jgi:hypothetical protein
MSEAEEVLAAELTLSGGSAFGKLQGTLTSQMTVDFELDGEVKKMPMPALINLRSHPDEATRRRGYEAENIAWAGVQETLAACLNGVKGETLILDKKRGREDNVHASIDSARMDRATLEAMLGAMRDSFPMFRRYFKHKAKLIGKEKLAWWDISAPLGKTDKVYSWDEARDFIVENFNKFSPELGAFAKRTFDENWIDGEQREGKRGGAFCMGVPAVKESRILANFDGSFDQVSTLAHEIGHAFHNECAYQGKQDRASAIHSHDPRRNRFDHVRDHRHRSRSRKDHRQAGSACHPRSANEQRLTGRCGYLLTLPVRKEVFERRANPNSLPMRSTTSWNARTKATYGDGWMKSICKNICGPGSRITTPQASPSTTIPMPSVCSSPPACMPSTKSAARNSCPPTKNCSPPRVKPTPPNSPTNSASTSAPKSSGQTASPSSAGAPTASVSCNR